jgi:hypothetical protein
MTRSGTVSPIASGRGIALASAAHASYRCTEDGNFSPARKVSFASQSALFVGVRA